MNDAAVRGIGNRSGVHAVDRFGDCSNLRMLKRGDKVVEAFHNASSS